MIVKTNTMHFTSFSKGFLGSSGQGWHRSLTHLSRQMKLTVMKSRGQGQHQGDDEGTKAGRILLLLIAALSGLRKLAARDGPQKQKRANQGRTLLCMTRCA